MLAISAMLIQACNAQQTAKKDGAIKPNILFVLAEDISTDLACYGMDAVKTPVLDELAAGGIQFLKAYGTNSICSPSRSNMMTGVHQNIINAQHHRSNRNIPLAAPYKPITAYLRDAGYTCVLGSKLVRDKGRKIDVNFKSNFTGPWNGTTEFGLFDKVDEVTAEDQPFFNQVTLVVTHRGNWWNSVRNESTHMVDPDKVVLPPYYADTPEIRLDWAKYLDQIEYMDYEMGLLLNDLEEKGLKENTIVIFIGDNGRCNIRGKGYLYEPGLHLPLLVNWPSGLTGGIKDERLVASIDVAATILDAAGIELPDFMTSKSILKEQEEPRKYVYSSRDLWDEVLEQSRAITTDKFRYIKNYKTDVSLDAGQAYLEFYRPAVHIMRALHKQGELNELQSKFFAASKESEELYDLINDPYETRNLIADPDYEQVVAEMKMHFEHWNSNNTDHGFQPINWENTRKPRAVEVLKWIQKERPDILEMMQRGIEPDYKKIRDEYSKRK
jgi:arylsulfatase A-like enzyme